MIGGPNDLYLLAASDHIGKMGEWQNKLFPLWFYESVEVLDGGEVLMNIVTGYNRHPILPGVVMSKYGKGQVLYCASSMESFYQAEGPDIVGELLQSFVKIASNKESPYRVDAPESIIANLTEAEDRMVLHLTNWTGNKFEKPWRNEYYISPVENVSVQIRIPEDKKVKRVYTLVETAFENKITGQNLEVFFPRVEAYQAVVVEFE